MSTVELSSDRDAVAPDGSEVRVLVGGQNGSMAHFTLPAGEVSVAVGHLTLRSCGTSSAGRVRCGNEQETMTVAVSA